MTIKLNVSDFEAQEVSIRVLRKVFKNQIKFIGDFIEVKSKKEYMPLAYFTNFADNAMVFARDLGDGTHDFIVGHKIINFITFDWAWGHYNIKSFSKACEIAKNLIK